MSVTNFVMADKCSIIQMMIGSDGGFTGVSSATQGFGGAFHSSECRL